MNAEHRSLVYNIVKYAHVMYGMVFGTTVRQLFLGSCEDSCQVDVLFENCEDAQLFLRTIAVEYTLRLAEHKTHGLNEYNISRISSSGTLCNILVRIHAYYSGITSRHRIPKNIPEPCFDIDYVLWGYKGLVDRIPVSLTQTDFGYSAPCNLGRSLDRIACKQFCIVNAQIHRSASACKIMMKKCYSMVRDHGYTQDNYYEHILKTLLVKKNESNTDLFCSITQSEIPIEGIFVTLPCEHVFAFDNLVQWIDENEGNLAVPCPNCKIPFISKPFDADMLF